jgi:streptomycin 3"-kinase
VAYVPVGPSIPAGLLPGDAEWLLVLGGESGATVLHDRDGRRFAKIVAAADTDELVAERDRIAWLATAGIPVPEVLDWRVTPAGACLVTRAVPGLTADRLAPDEPRRAWPAITDVVRRLHDVPVAGCPFVGGLATMLPLARATVAEDRVHVEFLPPDLRDTPATVILDGLEAELSDRLAQESAEQVVCHGDLCLPNILVDPETLQVTGLIDLGRLGRADPYADITLLLANAREVWPDEATARRADHQFARRYGIDLDPDRRGFYLRLDPLTW